MEYKGIEFTKKASLSDGLRQWNADNDEHFISEILINVCKFAKRLTNHS